MVNNVHTIRVAIVVSHPIQHFVHLYKALAKQEGIQLKVFFASRIGVKPYFDKDMGVEIQWASDLLGGYDHEFLSEADNIVQTGFWQINNPSIIPALKKFDPDVVQLHGYAQLTMLRALLWCNIRRIPVLLSTDSSLLFQRAAWKRGIKDTFLPLFFRLYYGVLAKGDNNTAYFKHYGVKPERLFRCSFTVDEQSLRLAGKNKPALRAQFRAQYEIADDEIVLLFVAKLIPKKRPQDLLVALELAQAKLPSVKLAVFFAGEGIMRSELEAMVISRKLRSVFAGFINLDVLPSIYAMADILVFPSNKEPYGLSALEAVRLGLPLIVSDQIGCVGASDAARPGYNALVYPNMDAEKLSEAIVLLISDRQKFKAMAEASLKVAEDMSEEKSVAGFLAAVTEACGK